MKPQEVWPHIARVSTEHLQRGSTGEHAALVKAARIFVSVMDAMPEKQQSAFMKPFGADKHLTEALLNQGILKEMGLLP